jgi:hypothetical protein
MKIRRVEENGTTPTKPEVSRNKGVISLAIIV